MQVGNNPKVMVGLGAGALLGVIIAAIGQPIIGGIVIVAAIGALVFVLRSGRTSEEDFFEAPDERPARREPAAATVLTEPEVETDGLPTWDTDETDADAAPLTAWTPPEDDEEGLPAWDADAEEATPDEALAEFEELDFADDDDLASLDAEFSEIVDDEPEAEEEAEPEYEFEPVAVAAKAGGFSFGNNSLIKEIEDVHSDTDIMKSSVATELNLSSDTGDNSELARLLSKVQSRLAAYD